jgi:hypothetical protein
MSEQSARRRKLDHARRDLLDLTARNRLIHTPRGRVRARAVEITPEKADQVYQRLVTDRTAMGLVPAPDQGPPKEGVSEESVTDPQASKPSPDLSPPNTLQGAPMASGTAEVNHDQTSRQTDTFLQTSLPAEILQKRLLSIFYDARTFEEEQGVNILYLAIGFLRWRDPVASLDRHAPLLLLPVTLERQSARARFRLRADDEEISTNLSLQAKLRAEFVVELPDVPPRDDLSPSAYFAQVAAAIAAQPDWTLLPDDMVLGFFSFSKFLMYRDLDPENWSDGRRLDEHPAIAALLESGFSAEPPLCGADEPVDPLVSVAAAAHVMDADSSQTIVIEEIKQGRNLVVQGPPGTGKSQTIANAIALAVLEGKTVLFVAEKMAALEVVKRRLDTIGLGAMCLELHSHKAHKATVLADLAETMRLARPKRADDARAIAELQSCRDRLNAYVSALHQRIEPAGISAYQVLGEVVRLRDQGVGPGQFTLAGATKWSSADVQERVAALGDLAQHLRELGPPNQHPWRGVMLDGLLPMDADRLMGRLPDTLSRLSQAIDAGAQLADVLKTERPDTLRAITRLKRLADRIAVLPDVEVTGLADPVWSTRRDEISRLVEDGLKLRDCQKKLSGVVTPAAWSTDVAKTRRDLAMHGRSWFRWLNRDYRRASAELIALLQLPPPRKAAGQLEILDTLATAQDLRWNLDVNEARVELGRRAFGPLWRGSESDWGMLAAISAWESQCAASELPPSFRQIVATLGDRSQLAGLAKQAAQHAEAAKSELDAVRAALALDLPMAFDCDELQDVPLEAARQRLSGWPAQSEALSRWIAYRIRWSQLPGLGLAELAAMIHRSDLTADMLVDAFWMAFYEELLREALARHPLLAAFDGASHQRLIAQFGKLDQERILSARRQVAAQHQLQLPTDESGGSELALLMREINKKRRHLPLRQLLKQAGRAVQTVKPVFMMSPISVAQFLEPLGLRFDLLLVDEASQVRPVDALGAIARADQMVVVGDDRQLPPTRFFDKVLDEAEETEPDETPATRDLESILDLCAAQGMAARMLRWHYRSRHHSLIAVSNREFYKNRLHVAPNPQTHAPADAPSPSSDRDTNESSNVTAQSLGLRFHHLPHARFDRGGTATNAEEAQQVARAVMEHARREPEQSLGVGAFSVAQRDAILDQLEELRGKEPQTEPFFATDRPEPFFVKNLENIQGDERDVVFISVGYGRDVQGKLSMHFGPLSNDGGERRLNVLITRARMRCEVFSSITADDIDLGRTAAVGARALKTFLGYARTGQLESQTSSEFDKDVFNEQVAKAVRGLGFEVHSHVGDAGLRVDLGVIDPRQPARYLLGIECDGASYQAARSARDRDRLRQQVLADRGWVIHRVWIGDCFRRPEEQLRALAAAIERAKAEWARRDGR